VDAAGRTMQEIVGSVKKVSDLIAEIAAASQEQSAGIEQVNTAVTQMDQVVQQNASLVEEAPPPPSVLQEAREVQRAVALIELGARLQFIEAEVDLSRERLLRLYKEIKGTSPPKGLLPFSVDWYMTWMANIHASMFYNIYLHMLAHAGGDRLDALIKAFRMYQEQVRAHGDECGAGLHARGHAGEILRHDMLQLTACTRCTGSSSRMPTTTSRLCLRAVPAALARRQEEALRR
jgi:hypothetical protein